MDKKYVSIVLRACSIVEADLTHSLNIHMDNTGYVTGLSVYSKIEDCMGRSTSASTFDTHASVSFEIITSFPISGYLLLGVNLIIIF